MECHGRFEAVQYYEDMYHATLLELCVMRSTCCYMEERRQPCLMNVMPAAAEECMRGEDRNCVVGVESIVSIHGLVRECPSSRRAPEEASPAGRSRDVGETMTTIDNLNVESIRGLDTGNFTP